MNNPDVERFESEGGKVPGMDYRRRPARASDLRQFNIDHAGPLKRDMLAPRNTFPYWFALIALVSTFGLGVAVHMIVSDAQTKTGAEAPACYPHIYGPQS